MTSNGMCVYVRVCAYVCVRPQGMHLARDEVRKTPGMAVFIEPMSVTVAYVKYAVQ